MGVKKSDWAVRDEKNAMLSAVKEIENRYSMIDDAAFNLSANVDEFRAVVKKYREILKKPMMRFFAGPSMEEIAVEAHEAFLTSLDDYIRKGAVTVSKTISQRLLESMRMEVERNIDKLLADMEGAISLRNQDIREYAANAQTATLGEIGMRQAKTEAITLQTLGNTDDVQKAWESLQDQYGTRATVKYRDGKNYPLNTYLDGRANTTSADIHRSVTQLDAAESGIYTGMISKHGATDSCRQWEGKIVFFTSAGRDIMAKKYPQALQIKTVDEIKADKNTHLWKFNCRHIITPYPVQFMADAGELLAA